MLYLITYSLKLPKQNYSRLFDTIKELGNSYYHCMESMWLVKSDLDEEVCASQLGTFLDYSDHLLVIDISHQPMQGMLPLRAWSWIRENDD